MPEIARMSAGDPSAEATAADVATVVECLRIQTNHRPLYVEQIRMACGVAVASRSDVMGGLAAHPRVGASGTQYWYIPAIVGVKTSKDLLVKLREAVTGLPREGDNSVISWFCGATVRCTRVRLQMRTCFK